MEGLNMNLCVQDCKITLMMKLIDNIAFLESALDNFDRLETLHPEGSTQHDEGLSNMSPPLEIKISTPVKFMLSLCIFTYDGINTFFFILYSEYTKEPR